MNYSKANKIINKFSKQRVVVVGDVILDGYIWGKVDRISPEAPVPVVHVQKETMVPGGAGNTANNLKSLSGQVSLVGLQGKDDNALLLVKTLRSYKLSPNYLVVDKDRPTTRKIRVMALPQHQVTRIDYEETGQGSKKIAKQILQKAKALLNKADVLVLSDYAKGVLTYEVTKELITLAKTKKIPVVVDPKPKHKDFYEGATVLTPNRKEALEISGEEDVMLAGKSIVRELDCNLLLTRSEDGMSIFEKGKKPVNIKTKAQEVFDVSGAGDTVVAALALSLAAGASLVEAADIANHAAGVVVGKVGTASLTIEELKRAIKNGN